MDEEDRDTSEGGHIPSDEFYHDPDPDEAPDDGPEEAPEHASSEVEEPAQRPEPGRSDRLEPEAFYREPGPPPDAPLRRWATDPRKHALALLVAGTGGVFLEQANILFQIVVGAPVFEELFKFGAALLLVSLLRLRPRVLRFVVALVLGAGFGVLEHYVTYASEPTAVFRFRLAFHAATPALSMAVYDAVTPLPQVNVRWAATVPATLVHWLNNFGAVFLGVASLVSEEIGTRALIFGSFNAALAGVLAVLALLAPAPARRLVLAAVQRVLPRALRDPPADRRSDRAPGGPMGSGRGADPGSPEGRDRDPDR